MGIPEEETDTKEVSGDPVEAGGGVEDTFAVLEGASRYSAVVEDRFARIDPVSQGRALDSRCWRREAVEDLGKRCKHMYEKGETSVRKDGTVRTPWYFGYADE